MNNHSHHPAMEPTTMEQTTMTATPCQDGEGKPTGSAPRDWRVQDAILDRIDSYIYVTDARSDRILFANAAFKRAFGDDCVGKPAILYVDIDTATAPAGSPTKKTGGRRPSFEIYSEHTDEWLAVSSAPMTWEDGRAALLIHGYNMTDRKLCEYHGNRDRTLV